MPNFTPSDEDFPLIDRIATRAVSLGVKSSRMTIELSVTGAHMNGCPLRLQALLDAGDGDFLHDVNGLCAHVSRTTGLVEDVFSPRFAA